jgi:hypothetical protein
VKESKEMKDYTVRRYSFDELEGEARAKAIEEMRNSLYEIVGEDELTEYLTDVTMEALGGESEGVRVAYSLSYCQGDGVAIYGTIKREDAPDLSWPQGSTYVELTRNQWGIHYSHYNSFNVEAYDEEGEVIEDSKILETQLRDLCRELESKGYKYIEGSCSEEVALDQLEDAGDVFTIDGKWNIPAGIMKEEEAK